MQLSRFLILVLGAASLAGPAAAQTSATSPAAWPQRIPAPGGEVLLPSAGARQAYDAIKYAASRRVGDTLYVSGVVAGGGSPGKPADAAAFKASLRHAFQQIERNLKAAGAGFGDVVMINSFHVWESPHFTGSRDEHFAAMSEIKDEFMSPPHPAWTAVGTTGLLVPTGLVEIQVIAHVPPPRPRAR
jgi:enamine deaminase RidA (YjgF/YER057c/UK114 family)